MIAQHVHQSHVRVPSAGVRKGKTIGVGPAQAHFGTGRLMSELLFARARLESTPFGKRYNYLANKLPAGSLTQQHCRQFQPASTARANVLRSFYLTQVHERNRTKKTRRALMLQHTTCKHKKIANAGCREEERV